MTSRVVPKTRCLGPLLAAWLAVAASTASHAATAPELPLRLLFTLEGHGPDRPFRSPEALLADARSRALYLADSRARQIEVSSLQGVLGLTIEAGRDFAPISLALLGDGRLLATDATTGGLKLFDASGKLQTELDLSQLSGLPGARAGRLMVDRKGLLYCVDQTHGEVLVFSVPWKLKLRLGAPGGRVRFKVPEDVAVDRFGRIYVSDSMGDPVTVFDAGGAYLFTIGRHGDSPGELVSATSLLVDRFDQVWVTDTLGNQIVIFDHFGWALRSFGKFGQLQGQLFHPIDLALDALGRVYIAEREGRRVQVFSYDNSLSEFSR